MDGIILTNKFRKNNHEDPSISYEMEMDCINEYIKINKIRLVTLNPDQINPYYTIPEALLYDLKRTNRKIDCLVLFSMETVHRFSIIFPEYWNQLRTYFNQVSCVTPPNQLKMLSAVNPSCYSRIEKAN